jgi:UDP-N-acetylmuramyl-tripeptide synthetase
LDISVLDVGFEEGCKVRSIPIRNDTRGLEAVIVTPSGLFQYTSPLIGQHNLENILCAAATGVALDLSLKSIREGIESVSCVPGRLERIPNTLKRLVAVDYAHTPDALDHVLSTLHQLIGGRLICVFGCGGDRDTGKRPIMGRIAARWADAVVVTSDNPRSEDPMAIIDAIVDGLVEGGWHVAEPNRGRIGRHRRQFWVEPDRRKAIRLAISLSGRSDAVLIAGKGHETYQIIGNEHLPFDDRVEAALALKELTRSSSRKGEKPSRHLKNAKP